MAGCSWRGIFVGWRVIAEMRDGGRELVVGVAANSVVVLLPGLNMDGALGLLLVPWVEALVPWGKGATVSFCGLARSGLWL